MSTAQRTAVIVGAGVTGLSTAYQLARMGYGRVIVFDKDGIGAGSSRRAAGITTGLLWSETGIRARQVATRLFRELSRDLPGYVFHNEHGCLNLFDERLWPARERLLPVYDRLLAPYQVLGPEEIQRRWPALRVPKGFLGLHDPLGGYSEPTESLAGLRQRLLDLGVELRERETVSGLELRGDRIVGVRTASGVVAADAVVAATYAWTLPFLASAGITLPAKTFVHQRYVSEPLAVPPPLPPVNADPFGGYLRPAHGGRILLGVETPARPEFRVRDLGFRLDELSDQEGLRDRAIERFRDFFPPLATIRWESAHVGLLSFSLDGEPILGPVPGCSGLFVGLCFHSGGFSYSPASGRFLAEYVANGAPSIDLTAFLPGRNPADETQAYLAATISQDQSFRRRH